MMKRTSLLVAPLLLVAVSAFAQEARVKGNRTPLRAQPTTTSTAVAYFQMGTTLVVVGVNDGWYRVRNPQSGQEGYVLASLVEIVPGSTGPGKVPSVRTPTSPPFSAGRPAPRAGGRTDRGFIALGASYQYGLSGFSNTLSFTENVEEASVAAAYPSKKAVAGDVGGVQRVWRSIGVGASVTVTSMSTTGTVAGVIPHPFFFDAGRPISGSAPLKRTQIAIYPFVSWSQPMGQRFLVTAGAGPSIVNLKQSLVEGVGYTQSYPYDSVTFTSAKVADRSAWGVGYSGNADLSCYFTKNVGIGVAARYSRTRVALPSSGTEVKVNTGGFEWGLGLRFRFRAATPQRPPVRQPLPGKPIRR